MTTLLQPYLFFGGRADEAIDFYQRVLGAKLVMRMRFRDNPEGTSPEALAEKVCTRGWTSATRRFCFRTAIIWTARISGDFR